MEFLTIQIEQISKNYIQIQQIKNVVADPEFGKVEKRAFVDVQKEIKESKSLQSQTIFPINKMVIQTISDVIPQNIFANGSFIVSEGNSDMEFCSIILTMLNFNSFALPKYTPNQIEFKNDIEFYHVENQFWFNGEQISFNEIMNILLKLSGAANGSSIEWGNVVGTIENQPDLMSQFNARQINQVDFVLDQQMKYECTIGEKDSRYIGKCQVVQIDFGSFTFNPSMKYMLLVDRYRPKSMKKNKNIVDPDGNVRGIVRKYRKGKFHHENQTDAEKNKRINELEIDIEKLKKTKMFPVYMQQENYFNEKSFPFASGISRKYNAVTLGFRLRITNGNDGTSIETGFIGFIKMMVAKSSNKTKEFTISFRK